MLPDAFDADTPMLMPRALLPYAIRFCYAMLPPLMLTLIAPLMLIRKHGHLHHTDTLRCC